MNLDALELVNLSVSVNSVAFCAILLCADLRILRVFPEYGRISAMGPVLATACRASKVLPKE
jgi:hypothetical protein